MLLGFGRLLTLAILFILTPDASCSSDSLSAQHIIDFIRQDLTFQNPILIINSNNDDTTKRELITIESLLNEASERFIPFTYYETNYDFNDFKMDSDVSGISYFLFARFSRLIGDFNFNRVILYAHKQLFIFLRKDKSVDFAINENLKSFVEKGSLRIFRHQFLDKIPNYHLKKVTIAAVITFPFVNQENTGIDNEIVKVIAQRFNFTADFIHPPDRQWGNYNNGTWSGVVGMIHAKVAEMAIGQLSRIPLREEFIDFSYPYAWDAVTFIVRSPRPLPKAVILIKPFSRDVWLWTIFSFLIVSITLKTILAFEKGHRVPFGSIVIYLFGSLILQGNSFHGDHLLKIRTLIVCWWILCIVLVVLYSTSLISMLNVDINENGIETRDDLERAISQGRYQGGTVNGSTFLMNIQNSYDGSFGEMRKVIAKDKRLITPNLRVGVAKSLRENYAFVFSGIALKSYAQAMTSSGSKMFYLSHDRYYTTCYGVATTKGYPFRVAMDKIILFLVESGLIRYWKNRVVGEGLSVVDNSSSIEGRKGHRRQLIVRKETTFAFRLKDVQVALDILWIGCVTAIAACVIEMIFLTYLEFKRTDKIKRKFSPSN